MSKNCTSINALTKSKRKKNRKKFSFECAVKKRKTRKVELTQEKTSKAIKLYLLNNADFKAQVNPEDIKKISEKYLIFEALSLELHIVLEILQKFNPFMQEKWPQVIQYTKLTKEKQ